jgi:ribose transport system ATP-binding protein
MPISKVEFGAGLQIEGISKSFGGTVALDAVGFGVPRGKVTALLGQNGAGKSTIIKILAGYHAPDESEGFIRLDGKAMTLPVVSREVFVRGLRFVHQDLGLVDDMSVAENFALADEVTGMRLLRRLSKARERRMVSAVLERFSVPVHPDQLVRNLDPTSKTMVAIARAARGDHTRDSDSHPPVLVLDEPTAALPAREVDRVLTLVRLISESGGAVLYVTHRMDEVQRIADRLVVLRDGKRVAEQDLASASSDQVVELILGLVPEEAGDLDHRPTPAKVGNLAGRSPLFSVRRLSGRRVNEINFDLAAGEILGISGLLGCGRSELLRILAGVQSRRAGETTVGGRQYLPRGRKQSLDDGIGYVPPDRKRQGCVPEMDLRSNLTLGALKPYVKLGRIDRRVERRAAEEMIHRFDIRPGNSDSLMAHLSGGNQQKSVIARVIQSQPRILILDEPMQGIDIGAKHEIAGLLRRLAAKGTGVIVGSSDTEDLVGVCDRVMVLNRGECVHVLSGADITVSRLTSLSSNKDTAG